VAQDAVTVMSPLHVQRKGISIDQFPTASGTAAPLFVLAPQSTSTMISITPLANGLHSPVCVPVTRIAAVVVAFGVGGMPVTEVTVMEHAITTSRAKISESIGPARLPFFAQLPERSPLERAVSNMLSINRLVDYRSQLLGLPWHLSAQETTKLLSSELYTFYLLIESHTYYLQGRFR
jgi:hypothetical protein